MKIQQLKKMNMMYSSIDYSKSVDENDHEFIVIALKKFGKLVAVAEAAKKLIDNTPSDSGFVQVTPAKFFFDLEDKLFDLEIK